MVTSLRVTLPTIMKDLSFVRGVDNVWNHFIRFFIGK